MTSESVNKAWGNYDPRHQSNYTGDPRNTMTPTDEFVRRCASGARHFSTPAHRAVTQQVMEDLASMHGFTLAGGRVEITEAEASRMVSVVTNALFRAIEYPR